MKPIRILLAEDHALMREGTRHILERYPDLEIVGETEDGEQTLALLQRLRPDVVILDIRLPKVNGIEVVRQMSRYSPDTKALMLTAYDDDDYVFALMEAGAHGYLLKTTQPDELVEAIRSVYSGETVLHPDIAAKVASLWAQRRLHTEQEPAQKLSLRELEVLELASNGLRNKAIADQLCISTRTVEGHFNNIYAKLAVTSRVEAVLYAISHHLVPLREKSKE